jgi:voltage-gated potassium channel
MDKLRLKIFGIICSDNKNKVSKIFDTFIMLLIVINIFSMILESFSSFQIKEKTIFSYIETISVIIFTIEYILRLITADFLYKNIPKYKAFIKYIFSFMAIIDLLAILPFYLSFIKLDLRILRALRLLRLLRILKFNRYTNALKTVANVIKNKSTQLISSMAVVAVLILISSIIMYNVENPAQPEVFKNALSGIWWAIATLTTVGYGDIYPITTIGKLLSAVIALLGIGFVAIPTGIISAGFIENIEENEKTPDKKYCPFCGKKLD